MEKKKRKLNFFQHQKKSCIPSASDMTELPAIVIPPPRREALEGALTAILPPGNAWEFNKIERFSST